MLRIGLTGGIGSGKSTVSRRLTELGAVVIDADLIAREVVEPGEPALEQIRERFGDGVFTSDGALDRPALGRVVFGDPQALADLEGITHPAIWGRTAQRLRAAEQAGTAVAVHDMPLLVEKQMAGEYHLVLVVDTDEEERVRRLVELRGMPQDEARSRIAAQATDEQRRAVADVLLDNNGSPDDLVVAVDRLWQERLTPFADNLATSSPVRAPQELTLLDPDPAWAGRAAREIARLRHRLGDLAVTVDHIGSTAVPMYAKPIIDLQVGVADLAVADSAAFTRAMDQGGWPRIEGVDQDASKDGQHWPKRYHLGCDPAVPIHLHVREVDSPGWRWALLFRDWLRADESARTGYRAEKHRLAAAGLRRAEYADAKEPWFDAVSERIEAWARETGWSPDVEGA
ncbi:dephospho-CoA kinase [Janibacter limosus]|jgi:dephospho-CoA kinase|uniref:Dephospho-CoA kinase n=1 Tax=Janibacter limosus TaxID=53458 RepID=A0A4P6MQH6_9MICO|nr:dephospho-CoA kinase [Janibacter limosus]QBF45841.1 dephospho-CoA kinase [Janibacter limosus]